MTQAADLLRGAFASVYDMFSAPCVYERGSLQHDIRAAVRGLRGDELFGAAAQGDRLCVIRYEDFTMPGGPQRFDRVRLADGTYTVQDWQVSPAIGTPVFYRLALRGGTQ